MFELLEQALRYAPHWTELRFHKRVATSVAVEKGEVRSAKVVTCAGVGVRVLVDGAWGFSSTNDASLSAVKKAIDEAGAIASFMAVRKQAKATIAERPPAVGEFVLSPADPVSAHGIEEKIELTLRAEADVRSKSAQIVSASSNYTEYLDEKHIVTSDGVRCRIVDAKPSFRVDAVAGKDGQLCNGRKFSGVTGGWADLFSKGTPEEFAEQSARLAVEGLSAPYADGGVFTVVLDPEVVGLLCHEAIGHTVEADFVLSGSVAANKIGHKVASDLVTLCDAGPSELQPLAAGTIPVDDEGTATRRTVIIENGVLRSYLHNLETAAHFGVEPTGNARAWQYSNEPIIRMRNTYLEPRDHTVEEMIDGIKDGYYLKGAGGGQADANAEFMFATLEAYRIRDGKQQELVREATISGQAFSVLETVDAVGTDFMWAMGSGHCGKGQLAKVDGGGPSVRCKVTVGGKQGG
ncbi:TldD/PmbA family protein [Planctomycetota bacterium]